MPRSPIGLLLAVVALAIQLAAASVVPAAGLPAVDRLLASSICHAADPGGAPAHHAADCLLCPLCQAIAHAGLLLGPVALAVVAPAAVVVRAAMLPPARAPPVRFVAAASARGPPVPT